jgi:2-dehydro-3-deoxyphosphogluconate aldolase/(4S)-4-hydroxy-2-oxoglutarate aldolase
MLRQHRAIAVIRTDSIDLSLQLAKVAIEAGMGLVEITWNSDQPGETIAHLRHQFPHCAIGTGTVLSQEDLLQAVASGAQFCFTPHSEPELITSAVAHGIPIIPGAFSPTEIVQAWQRGATAVKVFPIKTLGGVDYIQALQGPLGQIPLIPTGGVTLANAQAFLAAGAIAVGLSGQLFPPNLVATKAWREICDLIRALLKEIQTPRD